MVRWLVTGSDFFPTIIHSICPDENVTDAECINAFPTRNHGFSICRTLVVYEPFGTHECVPYAHNAKVISRISHLLVCLSPFLWILVVFAAAFNVFLFSGGRKCHLEASAEADAQGPGLPAVDNVYSEDRKARQLQHLLGFLQNTGKMHRS